VSEKSDIDSFGVAALVGFFLLLAVNQVVMKITNGGFQPVFAAGLRSSIALGVIVGWMHLWGRRLDFARGTLWAGVLVGLVFAAEFLLLFVAVDLTTVTRVSVIFYSMPVWMALAAHVLLPGERLTPVKSLGLALAFGGVAWVIIDRSSGAGQASLAGDLAALGGALGWVGVSLAARVTPLARLRPEMQLFWQLAVSAPVLLAAALFFGPFIRDLGPVHWAGLAFQSVVVASMGFVFWFWLLKRYKASSISSFAFLSPIFGVAMGWTWLDEPVTPVLLAALVLVAAGIVLINRPTRPR
jgi:drug/metabolite transporter (DMT)-like permease